MTNIVLTDKQAVKDTWDSAIVHAQNIILKRRLRFLSDADLGDPYGNLKGQVAELLATEVRQLLQINADDILSHIQTPNNSVD